MLLILYCYYSTMKRREGRSGIFSDTCFRNIAIVEFVGIVVESWGLDWRFFLLRRLWGNFPASWIIIPEIRFSAEGRLTLPQVLPIRT